MATSATSALDSSLGLGEAIKGAAGNDTMDKNAFLMLLVTQFKYQDPLNPMEDKEFVAQLAQFSALEQTMQTNTNLESLIDIQNKQTTIGAANYIGREVSARGYGVSVTEGKPSKIEFATAEDMTSGYANILNGNSVVATVNLGSITAGSITEVPWDGKLSTGGIATDGVYTVAIVAYNAEGKSIEVDTQVSGKVEAVSSYNGEHYLRLTGGRTVLLSSVREIIDPNTTTPATSPITVEDGKASVVGYKITEAIVSGTAVITDGKGKQVAEIVLNNKDAGTHSLEWDAKGSDGEVVADGEYTVTFSGKNAKGNAAKFSIVK